MTPNKPKITIKAINEEDKEKARQLEVIANWNYVRYQHIIEKVTRIPIMVKNIYGIDLPMDWFNDVIEEVVKMDLEVTNDTK